jgi:hypothetical protein
MADRMLDIVSKLLTQAENEGATPEERATFMEKAQELSSRNGIDLALARMHQAKKEKAQEPEERRLQVNPYARKINRKHFMELAMNIARVNDIEFLIGGGEYVLHAVGFPEDLDVLEALYVHLSIQMVLECDAALKAGANREIQLVPKQTWEDIPEDERDDMWGTWCDDQGGFWYNDSPGYPRRAGFDPPKRRLVPVLGEDGEPILEERSVALSDGRAFRHEFYQAYVARMHARLWGAKRQAMADAGVEEEGSNSTSLAIRDKQEEIKKAGEAQRAKVAHLGVYEDSSTGRRSYDASGAGRREGVKAAEATPIGSAREVQG